MTFVLHCDVAGHVTRPRRKAPSKENTLLLPMMTAAKADARSI